MSETRVGRLDEIGPGQCRSVRVGIRRIAVWNIGGRLVAYEDACRHMKAPLSPGRVVGSILTCSWHGWKYDLTTGACLDKSWGCLRAFAVRVAGDEVFVSDAGLPGPEDGGAGEEPEDIPRPVFRS